MKYHYQEGISDSKKEGSKLKVAFFSFVGLFAVGYVGLLSLTPVLSGWPLVSIDDTANALQSSDPGSHGNKLYIPRLNVASPAAELTIEGDPSQEEGNVTIQGKKFQLAVTPQATRQASPFYYLDKLQNGDEIFLDYNNTRYAYRISSSDTVSEGMLTLKSGDTTVKAQSVGTVARENGKLEVQDKAF